jgi:hypothetical protein
MDIGLRRAERRREGEGVHAGNGGRVTGVRTYKGSKKATEGVDG